MTVKLFAYADGTEHGIGFREGDGPAYQLSDGQDLRCALLAMATECFRPAHAGAVRLSPNWRARPPIARPEKILGAGQNYAKHAKEMGTSPSQLASRGEPLFFPKLSSSLIAHGEPIVIPRHLAGTRIDHEAELAVILGRPGRCVAVEDALALVAGYTLANDVTARDLQAAAKSQGHPWVWAKGQDTFCPIGPMVVPAAAITPQDLEVICRVNGQERQRASTAEMIWSVAELIAAASRHVTLQPGDIILTGTPAGVGPLLPGDTVEVEIPGIGVLSNPVVAEQ